MKRAQDNPQSILVNAGIFISIFIFIIVSITVLLIVFIIVSIKSKTIITWCQD